MSTGLSADDPEQMANLVHHIRKRLPFLDVQTVFDGGAAVGSASQSLRTYFPTAWIHAFEPVPTTFARLQRRLGQDASVTLTNAALGAAKGEAHMTMSAERPLINQIVPSGGDGTVPVISGDGYCREHDIAHINYFKLDVEGHELQVLEGFSEMLSNNAVDLLDIEAGLAPKTTRFVPFNAIKEALERFGYGVFYFHQLHGRGFLDRCNAVFISSSIHRQAQQHPNAISPDLRLI